MPMDLRFDGWSSGEEFEQPGPSFSQLRQPPETAAKLGVWQQLELSLNLFQRSDFNEGLKALAAAMQQFQAIPNPDKDCSTFYVDRLIQVVGLFEIHKEQDGAVETKIITQLKQAASQVAQARLDSTQPQYLTARWTYARELLKTLENGAEALEILLDLEVKLRANKSISEMSFYNLELDIAEAYFDSGNLCNALQGVVSLWQEIKDKEHSDSELRAVKIACLELEAMIHDRSEDDARYEACLLLIQEILGEARSELEQKKLFEVTLKLAKLNDRQSCFKGALSFYEAALCVGEKCLNAADSSIIEVRELLVDYYRGFERALDAITQLSQIVKALREAGEQDSLRIVDKLLCKAALVGEFVGIGQAEALLEEAKEIVKNLQDNEKIIADVKILIKEAEIKDAAGRTDYGQILRFLNSAVEQAQALQDSQPNLICEALEARFLFAMRNEGQIDDYGMVLQDANKLISIRHKQFGRESSFELGVAYTYKAEGLLLMSDFSEAAKFFNLASWQFKRINAVDCVEAYEASEGLALVKLKLGHLNAIFDAQAVITRILNAGHAATRFTEKLIDEVLDSDAEDGVKQFFRDAQTQFFEEESEE